MEESDEFHMLVAERRGWYGKALGMTPQAAIVEFRASPDRYPVGSRITVTITTEETQ